MPQATDSNGNLVPGVFTGYGSGQSISYTGAAGVIAQALGSVQATATVTSTNVAPSDGDTITIGNKTYTFKTALTPTEGQVLINTTADAALLNLIRAINHTGTSDTDYKCAAAHTQVSAASSVTAHAFLITALSGGAAANAYALSSTGVTHSWSSATLVGGVDNARNIGFVRVMCTTAAFVKLGSAPTATTADISVAANTPIVLACSNLDKVSAVQVASGGTLYVTEIQA